MEETKLSEFDLDEHEASLVATWLALLAEKERLKGELEGVRERLRNLEEKDLLSKARVQLVAIETKREEKIRRENKVPSWERKASF